MNNLVTKFVVLQITYNNTIHSSPEKWAWNILTDCEPEENVVVYSVRDFPPKPEF
jgi:hypothetical protein